MTTVRPRLWPWPPAHHSEGDAASASSDDEARQFLRDLDRSRQRVIADDEHRDDLALCRDVALLHRRNPDLIRRLLGHIRQHDLQLVAVSLEDGRQ